MEEEIPISIQKLIVTNPQGIDILTSGLMDEHSLSEGQRYLIPIPAVPKFEGDEKEMDPFDNDPFEDDVNDDLKEMELDRYFGENTPSNLTTDEALAELRAKLVGPPKYVTHDPVNHPSHYTAHPSGVECITITEHFNFNIGNAIKYLWRCGLKESANSIEDLKKAQWYVNREIERLEKLKGK